MVESWYSLTQYGVLGCALHTLYYIHNLPHHLLHTDPDVSYLVCLLHIFSIQLAASFCEMQGFSLLHVLVWLSETTVRQHKVFRQKIIKKALFSVTCLSLTQPLHTLELKEISPCGRYGKKKNSDRITVDDLITILSHVGFLGLFCKSLNDAAKLISLLN